MLSYTRHLQSPDFTAVPQVPQLAVKALVL